MTFSPYLFINRRWRWPTVAVILGILFLARLGFWQLDRLEWRRDLNTKTAAELAQPPISLNEVDLAQFAWETMENRQIVTAGRFDLPVFHRLPRKLSQINLI